MTLSQCTKADLLWIVKRLQMRCRYDVDLALTDLAYEKEKERIAEAEKYCKLADKKRKEYIEIMRPYDGKRLIDIPLTVLNRADEVIKEAQSADEKWAKLMGISLNSGTSVKDGDGNA